MYVSVCSLIDDVMRGRIVLVRSCLTPSQGQAQTFWPGGPPPENVEFGRCDLLYSGAFWGWPAGDGQYLNCKKNIYIYIYRPSLYFRPYLDYR